MKILITASCIVEIQPQGNETNEDLLATLKANGGCEAFEQLAQAVAVDHKSTRLKLL